MKNRPYVICLDRWISNSRGSASFFSSFHFIHLLLPLPSLAGCVLPYCVMKGGGSHILAFGDSSSACDLQRRAKPPPRFSTAQLT